METTIQLKMAKGSGEFTFTLNEKDYQNLQMILSDMSNVDKRKAIMGALLQGAKAIARVGKSNLKSSNKKKTGNLLGSITSKAIRKLVSSYAGFKKSGVKRGNHAHLVDRGTAKRWTKKGAYRGSVSKSAPYTGTKFWTTAVKQEGPMAMRRVTDVIYDELLKISKRKNK